MISRFFNPPYHINFFWQRSSLGKEVWAMLSRYQNAAAAFREYCRAISGKTPSWAKLVINLV
jgi:hypothetical protein